MNERKVLLAGTVGSTAYGLAHAGSDMDKLGLFAAPTERLLGLVKPPQSVVRTNPDLTLHEAEKWCKLALGCNPTAIELVWLDEYDIVEPLGAQLVDIRKAFLSAKAVRNAYLGYATQQLTKLKNSKTREGRYASENIAHEARTQQPKHARHLYRLLLQGCQLHQTGELMIKLPDPELVRKMGEDIARNPDIGDGLIRQGELTFNEPGVLPEEPDREAVEAWLLKVRWEHYYAEGVYPQ